ncbi:MAG: hypothetical protein EOO89_12780 [Pedobacter sp.]|nr:MAG: hypothetical protein EOO89_12780 [Pedobacter sp.]
MKLYAIALVLLPFSTLISNPTTPIVDETYAVIDTIKKSPTAAELKKMKKDLDKALPKGLSNAIANTIKDATSEDYSASPETMVKLNYEIEKEEIIKDFKEDSYRSAKDKREAKKEMKEDLKKLKQDYEKELKELIQDQREMEADLN